MSRSTRLAMTFALLLGVSLTGGAGRADELSLSNKWRIEVSEGANSDGRIVFRVTTQAGQSTDVTTSIKDGTGENHVAREIRDAFKAALDPDKYHVETDDGEDVLVKKKKGPDFELKFVESTVKSVRLHVQKE